MRDLDVINRQIHTLLRKVGYLIEEMGYHPELKNNPQYGESVKKHIKTLQDWIIIVYPSSNEEKR